jgi:hypothetical protein
LEYQQLPVYALCPNCQVHRGFYDAWGNFTKFIMPWISHVTAKYPKYDIVFTGHSLDGALATIGAVLEGSADKLIGLVGVQTIPTCQAISG